MNRQDLETTIREAIIPREQIRLRSALAHAILLGIEDEDNFELHEVTSNITSILTWVNGVRERILEDHCRECLRHVNEPHTVDCNSAYMQDVEEGSFVP